MFRFRSAVAAIVVGGLLGAGCRPPEEIATYTAPRELPAPTKAGPANADEAFRVVGWALPLDDKYSYFVKSAGRYEDVTPGLEGIDEFVASIEPPKVPNANPTFTVPKGWSTVPSKSNRIVTIKKGRTEAYLSTPIGGTPLDNVNRWRKEVGLRNLTDEELAGELKDVTFGTRKGYKVDLKGPSWTGGMMMPGK